MKDTEMNRIKMILQEEEAPYFTDTQIEFYVQENGGNIDAAIYQMLIVLTFTVWRVGFTLIKQTFVILME